MSAEATIAFLGVCYHISNGEVTSLEERSHPLLVQARQNALKTYWGTFGVKGDKVLLFVGERLGILGLENDHQLRLSVRELAKRIEDTKEKLQRSGIEEEPVLHLAWQPDVQ